MNDDFLYRLRKEPPPGFAQRLKERLHRQGAGSPPRLSLVRVLAAAVLIGGSVWAAALLSARGVPSAIGDLFGASDSPIAAKVAGSSQSTASGDKGGLAENVDSAGDTAKDQSPLISDGTRRIQPGNAQEADSVDTQKSGSSGSAYLAPGSPAAAREAPAIRIVTTTMGNSMTRMVAARYVSINAFQPPLIERMDTTRGLKNLCERGLQQPDLVVASRRITEAEFEVCRQNGFREILEAKIGYHALALSVARLGNPLDVSVRDIYLALAAQIPDSANPAMLVNNPNRTWQEVNAKLEARKIEIFGPPLKSGLYEAFIELVMEAGCDTYESVKALKESDPKTYELICHTVRRDGVYIEAEQTATLVTQRLWAEPNAIAILGYQFYEENRASLGGTLLKGISPTMDSLVSGQYGASRPLYIYMNSARAEVARNGRVFLSEYIGGRASNPRGYLEQAGLVPLGDNERDARQPRSVKFD